MSWIVVGVAAASAVASIASNNAKKSAEKKQANAAAAQTRYSPFTGDGPGQLQPSTSTSGFSAALSGGMQGALAGAMMKGDAKTAEPGPAPSTTPDIGGQAYAAQLGDQSQAFQNQMQNQYGSSWDQMNQPTLYTKR